MNNRIHLYKFIIFLAIIGFPGLNQAQEETFDWVKQFAGPLNADAKCVATDLAGNLYICGEFIGTFDFDPSDETNYLTSPDNWDLYIVKLDHAGNFLWARSFEVEYATSQSLQVTPNGDIFITGGFKGVVDFNPDNEVFRLTSKGDLDTFILKLDTNGKFVWVKQIGGESRCIGNAIAIDSISNVFVTGEFSRRIDFGQSNDFLVIPGNVANTYIAKLDSLGNFAWSKHVDAFSSLCKVDNNADVIIGGLFFNSKDFDPGIDTFYLHNPITGLGSFLLKLNPEGNFIWAKRISEYNTLTNLKTFTNDYENNIYVTGVYADSAKFNLGNEIITLISQGKHDRFILKIDQLGNLKWVRRISGTLREDVSSIVADNLNNLFVAGCFSGNLDFENFSLSSSKDDAFILKIDKFGKFIWAKQFAGTYFSFGQAIALNANNDVYTVGYFRESVDFNSGPEISYLTSEGSTDVFIHKLKSDNLTLLQDSYSSDIKIFPNPTFGSVNIKLDKYYQYITLFIINTAGQTISMKAVNSSNNLEFDIDGNPGVYHIVLYLDNIFKKHLTVLKL